jgi:hypothetical protein
MIKLVTADEKQTYGTINIRLNGEFGSSEWITFIE